MSVRLVTTLKLSTLQCACGINFLQLSHIMLPPTSDMPLTAPRNNSREERREMHCQPCVLRFIAGLINTNKLLPDDYMYHPQSREETLDICRTQS